MSQDMRTGVISLLFQDKGRRDNIDNYRPITVLTYLPPSTKLYPELWPSASKKSFTIHYLVVVDNAQVVHKPLSKNKNAHLTCLDSLVQDIFDHCGLTREFVNFHSQRELSIHSQMVYTRKGRGHEDTRTQHAQ